MLFLIIKNNKLKLHIFLTMILNIIGTNLSYAYQGIGIVDPVYYSAWWNLINLFSIIIFLGSLGSTALYCSKSRTDKRYYKKLFTSVLICSISCIFIIFLPNLII